MIKQPNAFSDGAVKAAKKRGTDTPVKAGTSIKKPRKTAVASVPVGRGTRRRLETRERLLDAALQLMSARGMEGVAINEITELADVGFGSFYNHFDSKEAIYTALVDSVFEGFADALDRSIPSHADPAEIIAASIRHTLNRAASDPVWASFLVREGLSARTLTRGLGSRLLRDIQKGVASGRFRVADVTMCFLAVGGTVLTAITAQLALSGKMDASMKAVAPMRSESGPIDQRTSTMCLQILGLKHREAESISGKAMTTQIAATP